MKLIILIFLPMHIFAQSIDTIPVTFFTKTDLQGAKDGYIIRTIKRGKIVNEIRVDMIWERKRAFKGKHWAARCY